MSCDSEQAMSASIANHNQVPRQGFSAGGKAMKAKKGHCGVW